MDYIHTFCQFLSISVLSYCTILSHKHTIEPIIEITTTTSTSVLIGIPFLIIQVTNDQRPLEDFISGDPYTPPR